MKVPIKKFFKKQKGIMLAEALISVAVLSTGALALTKLQSDVVVGTATAQQRMEASMMAQEKFEQLRHLENIDTSTANTGSTDSQTPTYSITQEVVNGQEVLHYQYAVDNISLDYQRFSGGATTYNRYWVITEYTNPNYKSVNMQVSWLTRNRTWESIQVVSIIGNQEPELSGQLLLSSPTSISPNMSHATSSTEGTSESSSEGG